MLQSCMSSSSFGLVFSCLFDVFVWVARVCGAVFSSPMVCSHDRMEQETPMISGGLKWWAERLGSSSKSYGVRSG